MLSLPFSLLSSILSSSTQVFLRIFRCYHAMSFHFLVILRSVPCSDIFSITYSFVSFQSALVIYTVISHLKWLVYILNHFSYFIHISELYNVIGQMNFDMIIFCRLRHIFFNVKFLFLYKYACCHFSYNSVSQQVSYITFINFFYVMIFCFQR